MGRKKAKFPKDNILFIRVDDTLKRMLKNQAEHEGLGMSAWIRKTVIQALKIA